MVLVVRQPGVLPEPDAFAQLQQMGVTVERPQVVMTADDGMRLVLENAARLERRSEGEVALRTETGEQRPLATERKLKVEVPNGRQFRLVLDDGSEVWLNAGSTLNYRSDFNRSSRDIGLSGEAYFEVARNAHLPFRVQARGCTFTVLGTRFNISAYDEDPDVLAALMEGSLQFESSRSTETMVPGDLITYDCRTMEAGRHRPVPQLDRRHHPLRRDLPPGPAPAARPRIRREDRTLHRRVRRQDLPHINHRGAGHRINHGRVVRHPADQRQARHLRLPRRQPPPKNRTLKKLLSKQT